MRGGFTFCGVDIADLGLEYAPESADFYQFRPASFTSHEETFDGHDGGYHYGTSVSPKEFKLKCYFEQKNVYKGLMTRMFDLFRRGKSGKLIFRERQWCYYIATVTENVSLDDIISMRSGVITIRMKAYYPFARSDIFFLERETRKYEDELLNTGLPTVGIDYPEIGYTGLTKAQDIILYNPGTERAYLTIELAGDVGKGVTITNKTNGQSCRFAAITKANTTNVNKWVSCDGLTGKTIITDGNTAKIAFLYHDRGFLGLDPGYPIERNVDAKYTMGTKDVTLYKNPSRNLAGMYIFIGDQWYRIEKQNGRELKVQKNIQNESSRTTIKTCIAKMNELTIVPDTTMEITKLNFIYLPTYA